MNTAMKQTFKKPSPASFLPLAVVVLVGVLFHSPAPVQPSSPSPIAYQRTTASTKESTQLEVSDAAAAAPTPQTKQQTATLNAPKQASIMAITSTEFVYHMFGTTNDPQASTDWTLTKDNAPTAWNTATGNNQTIVADIDTGFALNHEDLVNQWYQNPGEAGMTKTGDRCWTGAPQDKSTNNCDDDHNGYIDDWRGWNFVKADNNPQAGRINSSGLGTTHGTETAGFIGATGNNGLGSTAIDQHTKIMPLTVLDDDGTGYTSDIVAAIYYAVDNGAGVINLSLGTYSNDHALLTAINYASAHNVVIVAAAGNCGDGSSDNCPSATGAIGYPALYPDVISVGASTLNDSRASFSSYGVALDVSAPGYNLPVAPSWSAGNQTNLYASGLYGTSFSSPQVASLAALIKSIRPSTTVNDVTALIEATATKPANMNGLFYDEQFGHGIINASSALSIATTLNATVSTVPALLQSGSATSEHQTFAGDTLSSGCTIATGNACTIQLTNSSGYKRFLPYSIVTSGGNAGWSWLGNALELDNWEVRAQRGDTVSSTPYYLLKKS
ncbi:MAG: peptidase and in kexin sedolisin [Candidatus Saccharibacteria bacterium]|nr:peptidase and in kexin sedolisin [Candidatus Saccharibacteria bacterium]